MALPLQRKRGGNADHAGTENEKVCHGRFRKFLGNGGAAAGGHAGGSGDRSGAAPLAGAPLAGITPRR